jgi:hypothetical protein
MSKFTKGKWEYYKPLGVICTETRGIAQVYEAGHDKKYYQWTAEGEANARLISHAPEMYGYLLQMLNNGRRILATLVVSKTALLLHSK